MRRIFFDLETSPNLVLSWRVGYKVNIDCDNIIKERAIICVGYKWEGEKKTHVLTWSPEQDDKVLLAKFLAELNEADEAVAHNGDQFDLPWVMTRCAFHGLQPFPAYKTADTLQWARRRFLFNSNKLDYIASYLGLGRKIKTEFGLWKRVVLDRDRKALKQMADYCARDVELLEQVWRRMSLMVPHKTHEGVLRKNEAWTCPRCASENVHVTNTRVTARGVVQKQMQCKSCYGMYTISAAMHDKYLEAKKKKNL